MISFHSPSIGVFLLSAIVTLSACGKKAEAPKANPNAPVPVDVVVAKTESFSYPLLANGTVLPLEYVQIVPEVSGRIVELNIQEGSSVAKGTLLAKLNDDELKAQLSKYQAQLDIAEKTVSRLKKLIDVNGVNQQDYDQALAQASSLKADCDLVLAQIKKTEIRAPFSGVLGLRQVSLGAYVSPQQTLTTLQEVARLKIDFSLPEYNANQMSVGQMVKLTSNLAKDTIMARVEAAEPQADAQTRNIKFRAFVNGNSHALVPGQFVQVTIDSKTDNQSILVPTQVIIPESRNKKVALIKNGKVKFQVVETGYRANDRIQVISGLTPGDTIASSGLLFLKPDAPVIIKKIQ